MSIWTPPPEIPAKSDGDPLIAKDLKDQIASLQAIINGLLGDSNISLADRITYAKLLLTGSILDADIFSVSFSKFMTLKAAAQASPNDTIRVQAGTYISLDRTILRSFAGGNSPAFPNPSGPGQARIDVIGIDDAAVLRKTAGVEGGAPTTPAYPIEQIPICEVYVRYNGTGVVVKDTDDGVNSYIKADSRSLLNFGGIADGSVTRAKLADYGILESLMLYRREQETHIAGALVLPYSPKPIRYRALVTATDWPCGRGVVRGSKVYFCSHNADKMVVWDHVADTESSVSLAAGDKPGDSVGVGDDILVVCNLTALIKKVSAADVVTTVCDPKVEGPAAAAWTLLNGICRDDSGTILFTTGRTAGLPGQTQKLIRIDLGLPGASHSFDAGGASGILMPCFVTAGDGTEYVVFFKHSNTGGAGNFTIERHLAADLTAAGNVSVAAGATYLLCNWLGSDGQYGYVWDHVAGIGSSLIRIFDLAAATMFEVDQIPVPALVGSPSLPSGLQGSQSDQASYNQYPFFDGKRILSHYMVGGGAPGLAVIPVANPGAIRLLRPNKLGVSNNYINGFATDGDYIFLALSNLGATSAAGVMRLIPY